MGILINTGFDVGSSNPIDNRTLKDTIDEIDALVSDGKVYENLKVYCKDTQKEYRWTGTEWEEVGTGGSGGDLTDYQKKTDNTLTTTDKTVTGAINEVNGNLLDTVGFSADYKNIILNRKNGLNPYTIPISAIIDNTSLTELKDVDSTDVGNGKILVYDGATNKHKYVDSSITDEFVKMDSTTDANYLADLIDKSTVVNDNGVLKVKKLDGQEVTITEINYLKGLTMNVMDLVNAFANGGVKVCETPVNTYSDLETLDRSAFIDGISYIVYVLIDETHSNAKTTYLCTKTSTTFFGNADSQRNFTTNPIDLANEVTGKLGTSNIDVDNLWTLLTINDTYKTLTTNNEVFGTHGAKAMYDELTTAIGGKANATDLTDLENRVTTNEADITDLQEQIDNLDIPDTTDLTNVRKVFYGINELNNAKGTNISLVVGEDNTMKIVDALSPIETFADYFHNNINGSRFGIDANTYGTEISLLTITKFNDNVATIRAFMLNGKLLVRRYFNGVLEDWQYDGNTNNDVPKTTLTPVFPSGVVVASGGVAINYVVKNGWCNVNFAFNLASATTFSWTDIATGLPKPAHSIYTVLMNEEGKINRTIPIIIIPTGSVSSRVPYEITATDWWTGNISYPVAES